MTVESESSSRTFQGNDVTTTFATGFLFLDNAHITVTLIDEDGVETELTENTHYTLTGAGETAGGDVEMVTPPASGESLYIERNTPILQEVDLRPNGRYLPDTLEGMADKLTLIAQENRRRIVALEALGVSLADPIEANIVFVSHPFTTGADDAYSVFPFDVAKPAGSFPQGVWIVNLRNLDIPGDPFLTPPAVHWYSSFGDFISILHISGLAPNTNYSVRLAMELL
jgi:hypothetical protein